MHEAILFDMDDTILAEDAVSERCWRQVCDTFASCIAALGVNAADMLVSLRDAHHWYLSNPDRSREFGLNLGLIRREIVALAFDKLGVTGDSALTLDMGDAYHTLKSAKSTTSELVPGALDTIHYFRRRGVKLGLITNSDAQGQRAKIDRFNLDALFDSVVVEGEFGVGKPDARVFQHSLAALKVHPSQTWMVGDNLRGDIGGAQALGICGVWVDFRGEGLPQDSPVLPDRIVRSIVELIPRDEG